MNTIKSYTIKYDLETLSKLREVQEHLLKSNPKVTLNDTFIYCIKQAYNHLNDYDNNPGNWPDHNDIIR